MASLDYTGSRWFSKPRDAHGPISDYLTPKANVGMSHPPQNEEVRKQLLEYFASMGVAPPEAKRQAKHKTPGSYLGSGRACLANSNPTSSARSHSSSRISAHAEISSRDRDRDGRQRFTSNHAPLKTSSTGRLPPLHKFSVGMVPPGGARSSPTRSSSSVTLGSDRRHRDSNTLDSAESTECSDEQEGSQMLRKKSLDDYELELLQDRLRWRSRNDRRQALDSFKGGAGPEDAPVVMVAARPGDNSLPSLKKGANAVQALKRLQQSLLPPVADVKRPYANFSSDKPGECPFEGLKDLFRGVKSNMQRTFSEEEFQRVSPDPAAEEASISIGH